MLAGGAMPSDRHDVTVAEVLAAYLRFAKTDYRKGGELTNEVPMLIRIMGVVKELYSRERAAKFGPLVLKAVRQRMIDRRRKRLPGWRGLPGATALGSLTSFLGGFLENRVSRDRGRGLA